jgi:hypothetical protein
MIYEVITQNTYNRHFYIDAATEEDAMDEVERNLINSNNSVFDFSGDEHIVTVGEVSKESIEDALVDQRENLNMVNAKCANDVIVSINKSKVIESMVDRLVEGK